MLNRPVESELIEYGILFVSPELERRGLGVLLIAESIKRRVPDAGVYRVSPDNTPMLRFVERRMGPWILERAEERHAQRHFAG